MRVTQWRWCWLHIRANGRTRRLWNRVAGRVTSPYSISDPLEQTSAPVRSLFESSEYRGRCSVSLMPAEAVRRAPHPGRRSLRSPRHGRCARADCWRKPSPRLARHRRMAVAVGLGHMPGLQESQRGVRCTIDSECLIWFRPGHVSNVGSHSLPWTPTRRRRQLTPRARPDAAADSTRRAPNARRATPGRCVGQVPPLGADQRPETILKPF